MIRWVLAGAGGTFCGYGCDLPDGTPVQLVGPAHVVGPRVKRRCVHHAIGAVDWDAITTLQEARAIALEQAAAAAALAADQPAAPTRPTRPLRMPPAMQPLSAIAAGVFYTFDPKAAAAGDRDPD